MTYHAAILLVIAEYVGIDCTDLPLSFAAAAFDDHHSLFFVAWNQNQAIATESLESNDILRIKQLIQEIQPIYITLQNTGREEFGGQEKKRNQPLKYHSKALPLLRLTSKAHGNRIEEKYYGELSPEQPLRIA